MDIFKYLAQSARDLKVLRILVEENSWAEGGKKKNKKLKSLII